MRARLAVVVALTAMVLAMLPTGAVGAAVPSVDLADLVVTEPSGRSGSAAVALPIALSTAPSTPVVVGWRTVAGSAGTADFVTTSGSFTINAGSQGGGIPIDIRADKTAEATESFTVELTSVTGATIADGVGRVDIRDAATRPGDLRRDDHGAGRRRRRRHGPGHRAERAEQAGHVRLAAPVRDRDRRQRRRRGVRLGGHPEGRALAIVFLRITGDMAVEGTEWFEVVVDSVKNVGAGGRHRPDHAPERRRATTHPDPDTRRRRRRRPPTPIPTPTATPSRRRPDPGAHAAAGTRRLAAAGRGHPGHGHGRLPAERHRRLHRPGPHARRTRSRRRSSRSTTPATGSPSTSAATSAGTAGSPRRRPARRLATGSWTGPPALPVLRPGP